VPLHFLSIGFGLDAPSLINLIKVWLPHTLVSSLSLIDYWVQVKCLKKHLARILTYVISVASGNQC
jgi:hypothetical protein